MEQSGVEAVLIGIGLLVLVLATFVSRDQDAESGRGGVLTLLGVGLIIAGFLVTGGFR